MFDKVLSLVAPHECVGCGSEGSLICSNCAVGLPPAPARCYRCHQFSPGWRTCPSCRKHSKLFSVTAKTKYEGTPEMLVHKLKYENALAAARDIAELLAPMAPSGRNLIVSYLPTATSRVRSRGYDQSGIIARQLSEITNLPYANFLARLGQARQVGASRRHRQAQAEHAYRICNQSLLAGASVILIDDVITTGASLEAAAAVLKAGDAGRIYGLVFCQA